MMLNRSSKSVHPCLNSEFKGKTFSFFTVEYDVSCGSVICGFYYIVAYSLHAFFLEHFSHKFILKFFQKLFLLHMVWS